LASFHCPLTHAYTPFFFYSPSPPHLSTLSLHDALLIYLLWFLRQEACIDWLTREMNSNTGVPTLGKAVIERLPVAFPSSDEQLRSEEHTSELQSRVDLVCRLLLEKKKKTNIVRNESRHT